MIRPAIARPLPLYCGKRVSFIPREEKTRPIIPQGSAATIIPTKERTNPAIALEENFATVSVGA